MRIFDIIKFMLIIGKKNNYRFLILITVLAALVRFYDLNLGPELPPEQKASVILSASIGILSVIGLYFLIKELFDEKVAIISSFLLAISSWHILASQLGTKDIFASFSLIFAFYFLWYGLKYNRVFDFFLAGLVGGAGFYTGKEYFVAPIVVLLVFWNYWDYLKKDFLFSKYERTKAEILGGFSLLLVTVIVTTIPISFYIWQNPEVILSADSSIFSSPKPLTQLLNNIGRIIDRIILVNFSGSNNTNLVSWPISIFFVIGFTKEIIHWLKRKHGHFSVVHTFIFSWLFVMLIPALLSADAPSTLSLGIIIPPVILLSAKGIWWIIEKLNKWDHLTYPRSHKHWINLSAGPFLAIIALMISIALLELF